MSRGAVAGRRSASRHPGRRRVDPVIALAVGLPLLTIALALIPGAPVDDGPRRGAPNTSDLVQASLGCPEALPGSGRVRVAGATGAEGEVDVHLPDMVDAVAVAPRTVASVPTDDAVLVRARGDLAPGLIAARFAGGRQAALSCPEPRSEQWFTGVGGDAEHRSVIELLNPDEGPAVADLTILGEDGAVDAPRLRGVRVPGGARVAVDLAEVVPRRDELTVRVVVARGRLVTTVQDRIEAIGSRPTSADWLPPQTGPSTDNVLLGLPPGPGRRTLVVANPGDDETRVGVRVATGDSTFTPADAEELVVPPRSTVAVDLTRIVRRELRDGAVGLVLSSSAPVTATLRSMAGGDLSHSVPAVAVDRATGIVPTGSSRLLLSSVGRVGVAVVAAWDEDGAPLPEDRVELVPDAVASHPLPRRAALVTVTGDPVPLTGALLTTGRGAVVLPLRQDRLVGLVPQVFPGLP